MSSMIYISAEAQNQLRMLLLAFGLNNPYRVVNLDEIAEAIGHFDREQLREGLEFLSAEGLLTRFSGRYCFNRMIPTEVRTAVERAVSSSGTVRMAKPSEQGAEAC